MKRKILFGAAAMAVGVAVLPLFAAFEAHVINVTAKIENALNVPLGYLDFGTVFPQEHLDKPLDINLSQSFLDEKRVDDVSYIIRQKPKCAITNLEGTSFDSTLDQDGKNHLYTGTGHVKVGDNPATTDVVETYWIDCGPAPRTLAENEKWGVLPMLCPYISKHPDGKDDENATDTVGALNDGHMDSFHTPWWVNENGIVWNDVKGHLAKSQKDTKDLWTIDLAVPCFGGYCAQDWEEFVHGINPKADPAEFKGDIADEHKIFGCDLWVEVTGISLPGFGCKGKVDVMLVLDRSGSISSTELADLKTAAKAFVDALVPAPNGPNAGQVSFATSATLDLGLSDDPVAIKAAIDSITAGGLTNLGDALTQANAELNNNDRPDGEAPDYIIVITDGEPTAGSPTPAQAGINAANAAKGDGIEIFAVGVGIDAGGETYLKTNIVSAPDTSHYFTANNFGDLSSVLAGLTQCNED